MNTKKIVKKKVNTVVLLNLILMLVLCGCNRQEELLVLQSSESVSYTEVGNGAAQTEQPALWAVYVCGQVRNPGVVYLPEDARVVDAVEAAGGLTEDADAEYINLAARVSDGEKLFIPNVQEAEVLRKQEEETLAGYVNINTADKEALMTLPGIGESKALDILDYRETHGSFTRKEDLMNVSGIKESLFGKISDKIIVE